MVRILRDSISELLSFQVHDRAFLGGLPQDGVRDLPRANGLREYRQFRVLKDGKQFRVESENLFLAEKTDVHEKAMIGIITCNVIVALDMARYTVI